MTKYPDPVDRHAHIKKAIKETQAKRRPTWSETITAWRKKLMKTRDTEETNR